MFDSIINSETATNENTSVVSHDKQSVSAQTQVNAGVVSAVFILTRISDERELWEQNEYAASRKRLYEVLTQCYDYYITMKLGADKAIRGEYKKALTDFCNDRGYNFNSTTHDMQRIVKAVFGGSDRRRISAYAQALVAALSGGGFNDKGEAVPVLTADLSSWIEEQGGIEEIRTGRKNSGMTRKEQAQAAAKALDESNSISKIDADFKTYGLDSNDYDKQMLLVVTYRNSGEFEVNALVKDQSAVNEALACYFKNSKLQKTESAKSDTTENTSLAESN
jgi:hypothetical protein